MKNKKELSAGEREELLINLKARFENNKSRHKALDWENVEKRLSHKDSGHKLWSLQEMEKTGGEPDVVFYKQILKI